MAGSSAAATAFDDLLEVLISGGAREKALFGHRGLSVGKTSFGCLFGDGLALKLVAGSPEHARALALPGAELFDPSGRERPFKDWVVVPVAAEDDWTPLAQAALERAR